LALPWSAYQRLYDPPGNRLLKYHLAGAHALDPRSLWQTLVDSYGQIGWRGAIDRRMSNLRLQTTGDWRPVLTLSLPDNFLAAARREQFAFTGYGFAWWLPALIALPWVAWRQRHRPDAFMTWTMAWWISGWLVGLALIFDTNGAVVHQGTPLTPLLGFALLAWSVLATNRFLFLALASAEIALFLETWISAAPDAGGPIDPLAAGVALVAGVILVSTIFAGTLVRPARATA
jgi:hypothetical protein